MYLSIATRPDITYAINFLRQCNNNLEKPQWLATKVFVRLHKSTQDQGLIFKRDAESFVAFVDAD